MRRFFNPSDIAVFGVGNSPRNLAKNIVHNCLKMGFKGDIFPVGKNPGMIFGKKIITDPESLPEGIELAVILVPAGMVAQLLDVCGRKGIRRAIVSTGGFREFKEKDNCAEADIVDAAKRHGIKFIGPNCIGVICTGSGLCTPFNPFQTSSFKKGPVSIIAQSGGVATQSAHYFSEEHVGFSKIISVGNKLNLDEISFIKFLMDDNETEQIHLYLESIDHGRELIKLAKKSKKPIIIYKSNVSCIASKIAKSHTAALSNDDRVVEGALRQSGIVQVKSIHEMTVCAKAFRLPPLRGNRLVAISLSGGFSVILGDACEKYGFKCPELPGKLLTRIESFRRGGVIRMANPMDFGDIHNIDALRFAIKHCLALKDIDGLILSFMYGPEMARMLGKEIDSPEPLLELIKMASVDTGKPIGLSFFSERKYIEQLKALNSFPVFNDPTESVLAFKMLKDYWRWNGLVSQRI